MVSALYLIIFCQFLPVKTSVQLYNKLTPVVRTLTIGGTLN